MMSSNAQSATLLDLLQPIRRRVWAILLIVVVAVGASFGLSLSQKKKYAAEATFAIQNESRDLGLVGVVVSPTQTPSELANQAAQTIKQPDVLTRVKQQLKSPLSLAALASTVTVTVDTNASLIHVAATATSADGAAALANAFAQQAVFLTNQDKRKAYAAAAAQLARRRPSKASSASGGATPGFSTIDVYNEGVARLRSLAAIASPAQLTSTASPPGVPSSPRPVRNAVLAAVLGLMVGILVVYLWDSIDRRLRTLGEIENEFGFPVIGWVRDGVLGHTPNAGDPERAVEPVDWEQFRILEHNLKLLGASAEPIVIAVTSSVPEEGKTTVACFLAFAAAAAGKRTLLVECDLRRPALAERLALQPAPGLTDYVSGRAEPSEVIQVIAFDDVVTRNGAGPAERGPFEARLPYERQLACLTSGSATNHPAEVLESAEFRAMLASVREVYDLVILDTPPMLPVVDALEVIGNAEAVVLCGRETRLTRDQARAGKRALLRTTNEQPVGLVVTGIKPSQDTYAYRQYAEYTTHPA